MAEIIGENVVVGPMTVIQPKVLLVADGEEQQTVIGEENILEDFVHIRNSRIGSQNLIEVKSYVDEVGRSRYLSISFLRAHMYMCIYMYMFACVYVWKREWF